MATRKGSNSLSSPGGLGGFFLHLGIRPNSTKFLVRILVERLVWAHRSGYKTAKARRTPFEDLPGKWQAAILKAEENRPNLNIVGPG